jgi:hypothetical protein
VGIPLASLVVQGGSAGLLALVVIAIFAGRLVPRRSVDQERDQWHARHQDLHKDLEHMREALARSETARAILQQQLNEVYSSWNGLSAQKVPK